jgi:hypothetical protein
MKLENLPKITLEQMKYVEDGVLKTFIKRVIDNGTVSSDIVPIESTHIVEQWTKEIADLEILRKKLQEETEK